MGARTVLVLVLVLALIVLALATGASGRVWLGGATTLARTGAVRGRALPDPRDSPHVVVDTLNLAHWLGLANAPGAGLSAAGLVAAIDAAAPVLRAKHAGRVVFVLKDRETTPTDTATHEALRAAAVRNQVTVAVAEKYADPPGTGATGRGHSARGRDDFYTAILAARYRCAVATNDKLRDFAFFRRDTPPFRILEFTYWREAPIRDYIRPESPAYSALRKPSTTPFEVALPGLQGSLEARGSAATR